MLTMLYKKITVLFAITSIVTSLAATDFTAFISTITTFEQELLATITPSASNNDDSSLLEQCNALITTIHTQNQTFTTLYAKLLCDIADYYSFKQAAPNIILSKLIKHYDLPETQTIKMLFTFNCLKALLPALLLASTTPINTISTTNSAISFLANTAEQIRTALKLPTKSRWFKKRYLVGLIAFVALSISIYLGIKLYEQHKELTRLKQQEFTQVSTTEQLQNTVKEDQANYLRLQQEITSTKNQLETMQATQSDQNIKLDTVAQELSATLQEQTTTTNLRVDNQALQIQEQALSLVTNLNALEKLNVGYVNTIQALVQELHRQEDNRLRFQANEVKLMEECVNDTIAVETRQNGVGAVLLEGIMPPDMTQIKNGLDTLSKATLVIASLLTLVDRGANIIGNGQSTSTANTQLTLQERLRNLQDV